MSAKNEDAPVFATWEDVADRIFEILESELQEMDECSLIYRYPNWDAVRNAVDLLGDGAFDMGVAEGDLLDDKGWLDEIMKALRPDFEAFISQACKHLDGVDEWADNFFTRR